MINELKIRGFKSFVDETIYLAPLTLLTGLNSSGKSSVIQSIRILKRVSDGEVEPLLDGHGSGKELQNIFVKEPFSISCFYGKAGYVSFEPSSNKQMVASEEFPPIIYISADRFGPMRSIPIYSDFTLGPKGENVLKCVAEFRDDVINENLRHPNSQGETFGFNLEAWLGSISPGVKFQPHLIEQTDSSYSTFNEHRAMNVGFGLSYTLPIIVALFMGTRNPNTTVLLENPEAHLHPKGQTELARLICLAVKAGAQVVVETHSDHLFDGVRIFAKTNKGFAKNVCVKWFELNQDKVTNVESATVDDNGRLDKWPEGLFDQFEINASDLL